MKTYYQKIFEHEHWANLKVLEMLITAKEKPPRATEIFSHIISAQRIWLDRINGVKSEVKVWEVFDTQIMLELLEINYADLSKIIDNQDLNQLIAYKNSNEVDFINTISELFIHLSLHAAYHRGQVVVLLKPFVEQLPATDFVFFLRE